MRFFARPARAPLFWRRIVAQWSGAFAVGRRRIAVAQWSGAFAVGRRRRIVVAQWSGAFVVGKRRRIVQWSGAFAVGKTTAVLLVIRTLIAFVRTLIAFVRNLLVIAFFRIDDVNIDVFGLFIGVVSVANHDG
jgi:hypothetical protein